MRDRLSQLIFDKLSETCRECSSLECTEELTDYLLANGVIVPPYKVGEKVYVVDRGLGVYWRGTVISVYYGHDGTGYGISFDDGDFAAYDGRDVFRTKEEADAALVNYESTKIEKGGAE